MARKFKEAANTKLGNKQEKQKKERIQICKTEQIFMSKFISVI